MRIIKPPQINCLIMMITAIIGLIFNLIIAKCLDHRNSQHHRNHKHEGSKEEKINENNIEKAATKGKEEKEENNDYKIDSFSGNVTNDPSKTSSSVKDFENVKSEEPLLDSKKSELKKKFSKNINIRAAMIHVIGDILQSIGVLLASIILFIFPSFKIVDPICTFLFSIIVGFTTIPIISDSLSILMEGTPLDIDYLSIKKDIEEIEGVSSVHDLHIWSICPRKKSLTVHIISNNQQKVMENALTICCEKYKISHSTIQVENPINNHKCFNHLH